MNKKYILYALISICLSISTAPLDSPTKCLFSTSKRKLKALEEKKLRQAQTKVPWISKAGLIYGSDKNFGTRVNHILEHTKHKKNKPAHSVFLSRGKELFDLIDEAWIKRKKPIPDHPREYTIKLDKAVGTKGEKAIKIIVTPKTSRIITAYQIKV